MIAARRLVDALAAVASRYDPPARKEKLRLLDALEGCALSRPASLVRLHETLCFLQAYADGPEVLERVDRALAEFPQRVMRLGPAARKRLHDSGIANATLDYPFGFPMARWLTSRFPRDCEVAWARFEDTERLDETLSLLVALFERTGLPEETRDWLYESLALPVLWRPRGVGASRTLARVSPSRLFFHTDGLERRVAPLVEALARPLPPLRPAPRALAESLIDAARVAMATRQRELHAFSRPNPDDVLLADGDRGVRLAFIGIQPGFRLPLEGYYAFLALKNGIPVAYGGGWELFGTLDFAVNVFASFRQGESAFLATELLRAYRRIFGMRTIAVDRYQLGHESTEALRSGSFYFYHRLGFRPRDPDVLRVLDAEQSKIAADRSYRSPVPVLKRLAGAEVYLTLPGGHPEPEKRLRATDVSALVARFIAREFGGDRLAAVRESTARVRRALGVASWTAWPTAERRAFAQMSPVAALITDLEKWTAAERRHLVRVLRAKGSGSERAYANLLDSHQRFQQSLEALVSS